MPQLDKKLTLYGLTMIAVGACIGSGIFRAPGEIVAAVPNVTLVLAVWCLGGVVALTGALTLSELGGMFPKAGGVYIYLKEAYGDLVGFLYGWVILLVINTGALAALAITFADYMTFFIPLSHYGKIGLAVVTIAGLTAINIRGVSLSQIMANTFTGLKLLAIAGIIILGFSFYNAEKVPLDFSLSSAPEDWMSGILVGLIGVLWSMGGWHHTSYLAGEAINAKRTIPRAMVLGVLIVTVTYVLVNLAYMMLLPIPLIAGTDRIAGDAVATIIPFGGRLMALVIAVSVFGTIGIYTMSAPRIYYAMAKDGLFFKGLSKLHPRYKTPANAMLLQAVWAITLLVFWGSFGKLISYVTFMDIIFMTLTGLSIFIFRVKKKEMERPIRAWGYPLIPILFIVISTVFVGNTIFAKPQESMYGLIVLALGVPVYYLFKKNAEKEEMKNI